MNLAQYKAKTTETVVDPMIEFIEEWDGEGYTIEDARKCEKLIHSYLDTIFTLSSATNDAIMEQVKNLVLALNDLNEETDYSLIETEAREAIWEVIQSSAVDCGLENAPDDITEQWREW